MERETFDQMPRELDASCIFKEKKKKYIYSDAVTACASGTTETLHAE